MPTVTESVAAFLGKPSRSVPPMDISGPNRTADDIQSEISLESTVETVGAGWFMDDFLFLFGQGIESLAPCVEAWSFFFDPEVAWRIVGRNAYGALLVHMGPSLGSGSFNVLDPSALRLWCGGYGNFYECLLAGFVKKELTPFLEPALYAAWRRRSGRSLALGEMLALRPQADVGRVLDPDEIEPVDAVAYYRATAAAVAKRAKKDPKKNDAPSPRDLPELYSVLVRGKIPAALAAALGEPAKTTYLDLSRERLEELPPEIGELTELGHLELKGNALTRLPKEMARLKKLYRLNLNGNRLTELPDSFGDDLPRLSWLGLEGNRLQRLPDSIGRLSRLGCLWLEGNQIEALPDTIGDLSALEALDLSGNRLRALPSSMQKLHKLRKLDLQKNRLEEAPAWLHTLPALDVAELRLNPRLAKKPAKPTAGARGARVLTRTVGDVVQLRRDARKPTARTVGRVGGLPIGVTARTWPKHEGKPMIHVLTLDLDAAGLEISRKPRPRALAVFVPSKVEAWDHAEESKVLLLTDEAVKKNGVPKLPAGLDESELLDPARLVAFAIDAEEASALFDEGTLRTFAGGMPYWVQGHGDPHDADAVFVLQVEEDIVPGLEVTPGGVLYVFDTGITFQR